MTHATWRQTRWPIGSKPPAPVASYRADEHAWIDQQIAALRAGDPAWQARA
jgi:hypothetical protein